IRDVATGRSLLALLCHHVVVDHFTIDLILDEVQAILRGRADALPRALPYREFIAQTRAVPASAHEAYFRHELADVDAPTAPFDLVEVHGDGRGIDEHRADLEPVLAAAVREAARTAGLSPAVLFHLAWAQVLAACTGRDDVVFGTTLSGRLQGTQGA